MGIKWNMYTLLLEMYNGSFTVRNSLTTLQKLDIEVPYDATILLISNYNQKNWTRIFQVSTNTCLFMAALVTIAKR